MNLKSVTMSLLLKFRVYCCCDCCIIVIDAEQPLGQPVMPAVPTDAQPLPTRDTNDINFDMDDILRGITIDDNLLKIDITDPFMPLNEPMPMPLNEPVAMPLEEPMPMPLEEPMPMPLNEPVAMPMPHAEPVAMPMPLNEPMPMPLAEPVAMSMPLAEPVAMPLNEPQYVMPAPQPYQTDSSVYYPNNN